MSSIATTPRALFDAIFPATQPSPPPLALRDYQERTIAAIEDAERRGVRRQLVVKPTGSGKTVVFATLAHRRRARTLVLAHREELINQAAEKFRTVSPGASVGIVKAARNEVDCQIIIASVPTLGNADRLAALPRDIDLVIADEAHHAAAASWRSVIEHTRAGESDGPLLVGFTATADRGDGVGLDAIFDEVVFDLPLIDLIEQGYLSDIRAKQITVQADFNALHTRGGDFIASEVERALSDALAPETVARAYLEHAPGRKAIVFTPTIALAEEMASAFRERGIAAAALSGETQPQGRRQILADFKAGTIKVVCNAMVLTEGFDEPSVDCVIVARPTKSRSLYSQMIGRGTRRYPGKDHLQVLDLVGVSRRLDLMTAASLVGLPLDALEAVEGEPRGVAEAVAAQRAEHASEQARGELIAHNVALFRQRSFNWVGVGDGLFVLSFGHGAFLLRQDPGGGWHLTHRSKGGDTSDFATGADLGYLQGIAEDYARANGRQAIVDRAAAWRGKPASAKQVKFARSLGIKRSLIDNATAGEASDLIDAALARREVA